MEDLIQGVLRVGAQRCSVVDPVPHQGEVTCQACLCGLGNADVGDGVERWVRCTLAVQQFLGHPSQFLTYRRRLGGRRGQLPCLDERVVELGLKRLPAAEPLLDAEMFGR